jgi:hypothetical protein
LPYCGWYLDCPPYCIHVLKRLGREKFDLGFLEKLVSFQGNKEDIKKMKKKKKDVKVSSTPGAGHSNSN